MINNLVISGRIFSRIQRFPRKLVFTLENGQGRFYVEWHNPPAHIVLNKDLFVVVNGHLVSVRRNRTHQSRIQARNIEITT